MHRNVFASLLMSGSELSIPFAWDFSMHRNVFASLLMSGSELSIPFAWDFSMHRNVFASLLMSGSELSIPFAWDFSMHLIIGTSREPRNHITFNSLCLGFFHASQRFRQFTHER